MNTMHLIAPYVHSFFHQYLAAERGLSPNTIACYRDSLKLLFQFAAGKLKTPIDKLAVEHFSADVVLTFLNDLEITRGNSTRCCFSLCITEFLSDCHTASPLLGKQGNVG